MPRSLDVGVGTAVLILNDLGQLLILKRAGAHWADYWSVPGGWIDRPDNSTESALIREVEEEVGLLLRVATKYTWSTEDNPEIGCRTVTLYHIAPAGTWSGTPKIMEPTKCSEIRWVYRNELPEKTFPGLREVVLALPDVSVFGTSPARQILVGGSAREPRERAQRVKIFYVEDGVENHVITGFQGQIWGDIHRYITEQLEPDGYQCTRVEVLLT